MWNCTHSISLSYMVNIWQPVFSSTTASELACAVTIHKVQGLTLNKLCVELARRNLPLASHLLWSLSGQSVWGAIENKRKSHCMSLFCTVCVFCPYTYGLSHMHIPIRENCMRTGYPICVWGANYAHRNLIRIRTNHTRMGRIRTAAFLHILQLV